MRIRALIGAVLGFGLVFTVGIADVAGQDDGFGGSGRQTGTEPIEFTASATFVVDFVAEISPDREHPVYGGVSGTPAPPPCAKRGVISSDGAGNVNMGCVLYYRCGGERIDDVFSGDLSGRSPGSYADYLVNYAPEVLGSVDVGDLNDTFIDAELGDSPNSLAIPVFYFCRRGPGGVIETLDPAYSPSYGWDATVETEYDIITLSNLIRDEVLGLLDAAPPQVRMTPPVEKRKAIVQFPSWFWINEPASLIELSAQSDTRTILIEGRAILDYVEWQLGDASIECELDQMSFFDADEHHVAADRPHCSHVFQSLDDWELSATAHYDVEQRVTRRLAEAGIYDVGVWEPHPETPRHSVTTNIGTMTTHEIYSVNVSDSTDS